MAKPEKRTAARTLYMTGKYDLGEIATILGVSNGSITKWNREEGWSEEFDRDAKITNETEASIRELISYNLMVVKAKARKARKELDEGIVTDAADLKLITSTDIDGLAKLFAQIRRKELDFADKVNIIADFLTYASTKRPELFTDIQTLTDGYIEKISFKR